LASLFIFINQNYDLKKDELLALVDSKLETLDIKYNLINIEEIYLKTIALEDVGISFAFNKTDFKTIENIKNSFVFAGDKYNKQTQDLIKNTIVEAFKGNITRAEISSSLKEKFTNIIAKDEKYFELVADNIILQNQNISRVNQALKYDVKYFKVVAQIDSKTSEFCRCANGKIIQASHLQKQINNIINASSIQEKKSASQWSNKPIYGKFPANIGLPPYHARCRTMVVPVYLDEDTRVDERTKKEYKVINTGDNSDYKLIHIDKTGIEVKITEKAYNKIGVNKHNMTEKQLIGALNSIKYKAPHSKYQNRTIAMSQDGYVLIYEEDKIITSFPPSRRASSYFNDNVILNKVTNIDTGKITERIKNGTRF